MIEVYVLMLMLLLRDSEALHINLIHRFGGECGLGPFEHSAEPGLHVEPWAFKLKPSNLSTDAVQVDHKSVLGVNEQSLAKEQSESESGVIFRIECTC